VPFIGIGFTAAEMVKWMGRERRMQVTIQAFEMDGIGES
jgi:hypothetical protein